MATGFRSGRRGRVVATFDAADAAVLRQLLEELLAVLDDDADGSTDDAASASSAPSAAEAVADPDALAAAVGIGTATTLPEDPVLARLLPDAYADDSEAAGDFRRYTESGLRERKRAAARTALATLADPGRRHDLTPEQAQAWLAALNDLRLALGTRLGVTEDLEALVAEIPEDDPSFYGLVVYDSLTWMQETLVRALT